MNKKLQKQNNLEKAEIDLVYLEDDGHDIQRFTDIHCRIDGIDVWLTTKKWWCEKTYEKGNYSDLMEFIKSQRPITSKK